MEKVGFLLPDNQEIYMPYHEVYSFCKKIYEEDGALFPWKSTQFTCYFDYVMQQKGYIFIHPLYQNSYLVADKDTYYEVKKSKDIESSSNKYQTLKQKIVFEEEQIWMEEASNQGLNVCLEEDFKEGFVSREGIFYDKTKSPGHYVLANTIANQYLMRYQEAGTAYKMEKQGGPLHRSEFFLIRQFGFLEVDSNQTGLGGLLLNTKKIDSKQIDYIERRLKPYMDFVQDQSNDMDIQYYLAFPKKDIEINQNKQRR